MIEGFAMLIKTRLQHFSLYSTAEIISYYLRNLEHYYSFGE